MLVDFAQTQVRQPEKVDQSTKAQITADLLEVLNFGNKTQLKKLNCIGAKRAQLIIQYRSMNRTFQKLDDLSEIGMTSKMIKEFLKRNLMDELFQDD